MNSAEVGIRRVARRASDSFDVPLFEVAGTPISVATLVSLGLVLLLTLIAAKLLSGLLGRVLRARANTGEGEVRALVRVVHYAIWICGGAIALSTAGIDLTAFFAAGAVFAVAIGFALQNVVQNFVAGVILLLERAIKPGDILEVEGQMVKVVQMGIRTTITRTLDDENLIVPNGTLSQSSVKNFTLRDPEYRLRMRVGVAYSSDMELVRRCLTETARDLPWRLQRHEPRVLLLDFASSSADWEVSVWVDDPWRVRALRSELQLAVWHAFQRAGITIAFPQLDVHLDSPVAQVQERAGSASPVESGG